MITAKIITDYLKKEYIGRDNSECEKAIASHLRLLGVQVSEIMWTEEATEENIKEVEIKNGEGVWHEYYARCPDFFGLTHPYREQEQTKEKHNLDSRVNPRALLSFVSMLPNEQIATQERYAKSLLDIEVSGCKYFWVGHKKILGVKRKTT